MLVHVLLEVYPADLGRAAEFWTMVGFKQVDPPEDLADLYTWFERDGTQIHLMRTDEPTVPEHGHPAIVVPDLERTVERLQESGFEVTPKHERWGSKRAEAIAPSGHRVELMVHRPGG